MYNEFLRSKMARQLAAKHGPKLQTLGDLKAAEPRSCQGCDRRPDGCATCFAEMEEFGYDKNGVAMIHEVLNYVQKVRAAHPSWP